MSYLTDTYDMYVAGSNPVEGPSGPNEEAQGPEGERGGGVSIF